MGRDFDRTTLKRELGRGAGGRFVSKLSDSSRRKVQRYFKTWTALRAEPGTIVHAYRPKGERLRQAKRVLGPEGFERLKAFTFAPVVTRSGEKLRGVRVDPKKGRARVRVESRGEVSSRLVVRAPIPVEVFRAYQDSPEALRAWAQMVASDAIREAPEGARFRLRLGPNLSNADFSGEDLGDAIGDLFADYTEAGEFFLGVVSV